MLPWTPFALQHHRHIELDRAGERKKGNLGCKTNQVVPITEHLLGNDISCAETHRLGTRKNRTSRRGFSWIALSKMLPSSSNGDSAIGHLLSHMQNQFAVFIA